MEEGSTAQAQPAGLESSAVELLRSLIREDTVNPPGNERGLQERLAAMLDEAGFECELLAAEPERPNLLARLRGDGDGPTLAYLGHVDTVRADPEEWSRDPWCGDLDDGWVWGRGALDMKGQVAAELAAGLDLARSGWRPKGELLLMITADEEAGGDLGARWLCENHADRVRCDFAVNEGGGASIAMGERRLYTLSVGEKGIFRIRLKVEGRAGHASLPKVGDNALLKLAPLIAKLESQPPLQANDVGLAFLSVVTGQELEGDEGLRAGLEAMRAQSPENALLADLLVEPMLGITMTPTVARAGAKANVIPSSGEVLIDTRVPPGLDEAEARAALEALLGEGPGEGAYEIEFSEAVAGNQSEFETPLRDSIGDWLAGTDPDGELAPIVMPGFSDSHWVRKAFPDAVVYGFCPHREIELLTQAPLIHGADERVPAADIGLAARFFCDLARKVLGNE